MIFKLTDLIGKKIVAVKGIAIRKNQNPKNIEPEYILFDDDKTILELREQDYIAYHDCESWARTIHISESKEEYDHIKTYNDAKGDIH